MEDYWTQTFGWTTIYFANETEFHRLLAKLNYTLRYEDFTPTGDYDLYYNQDDDEVLAQTRMSNPPESDWWRVFPWDSEQYLSRQVNWVYPEW